MKTIINLIRAGLILALFASVARAEFSWTNNHEGYAQGLNIRYDRWVANDADGEMLFLADSSSGYSIVEYGLTAFYADRTADYDGAYGEFYAAVHYVIVPVLVSVDEWESSCSWVWIDGYWVDEYDEDGNIIATYWVDGHWERVCT
jgi:hypothetical protein